MVGGSRVAKWATVVALLATAAPAEANPGDSDGTFSKDGYAIAEIGFESPPLALYDDLAVAPDGRILLVGTVGENSEVYASEPVLVALRENGAPDTTIGPEGQTQTLVDFDSEADDMAVATASDGRIVVGVSAQLPSIARLTAAGGPDSTFSGDGRASFDLPGLEGETLNDVAVATDGRILLAGTGTPTGGTGTEPYVARISADGSALDPTYAGDGVAIASVPGPQSLEELALGADGSATVAGTTSAGSNGTPFVARFTASGDIDAGFGGGSVTISGVPGTATGVAVDAAGNATFSVADGQGSRVIRLNPAGGLDAAFGSLGTVTGPLGRGGSANDVALAADGSVLVAGAARGDFAVARFSSSGDRDPTFNGDGVRRSDLHCAGESASDVAIDAQGRIVAGGRCPQGLGFAGLSTTDFAVARYETGAGPADEDADRVLDPRDRCVGEFGPRRAKGKRPAGCPDVSREIRAFGIDERFAKGFVDAGDDACEVRQRIKLMRVRKGPDKAVARDRTDKTGDFELRLPKGKAEVYARVGTKLEPDGGLCRGTTSRHKRI